MIEPFEQLTIIHYLQNLLSKKLSSQALKDICDFLETALPFLGMEGNDNLLDTIDEYQCAVNTNNRSRKLYLSALKEISLALLKRKHALKRAKPGTVAANISAIARELDLDPLETNFLGLIVRYRVHDQLSQLFNSLTREHMTTNELCSTCLNIDRKDLSERLRPTGRLLASGIIIQPTSNGRDIDDYFDIPAVISTAMHKTMASDEDVRTYILGQPLQANLTWSDFAHLGEARDKLATFLTKVVDQQIVGVNILLWGPPGTGKSEFCKTLAEHLRLHLYTLGEVDDSGDEPNRKERTSSLRLAQNLLRYQKNSLLLFDEMDDLFENKGMAMFFGGKLTMGSKVFTNRLLENNPVPTLWTINDASLLDESVIRRMSLAMEIKVPPASSRENVWRRLLDKHQVTLPEEEISQLSMIEVAPAIADNAVRFAGLVGRTMEDFQFVTQGIIKATTGRNLPRAKKNQDPYLPELINADTDLGKLADHLANASARNFSLCLYGPPGTGKSAYVRYLAERLGMPVIFKRASDVISKYVGESEQNIARAFEEAIEKESFLVFDEADSLLGDRRYAHHSWEVSQVNEMLTWMENHSLPFACTTNLMDRLDQASLRRFTFKCHFDYLNPAQIRMAFKHFFDAELDGLIYQMKTVTPGDFAVAKKKNQFLGMTKEPGQLLELIYKEQLSKEKKELKEIGFMIGHP